MMSEEKNLEKSKPSGGDQFDPLVAKWEKRISECLPVGLVAVAPDHVVLWSNLQFQTWSLGDSPVGKLFYEVVGKPKILGPDFCPFSTVLETRKPTTTQMKLNHVDRLLSMDVAPQFNADGEFEVYLIEIRDVTENSKKELQLERLREAGKELADLSKRELTGRTQDARVAILKAKIAKFVREILHFQTIEIRLLSDSEPDLLVPLLAIEMGEEAKQRKLYARQEGNGITGWVAFHGKPYRMENKDEDAFYLQGSPGTESSITVPLLYHGKTIGTFNVESNQRKAFSEDDLRFLELFARDVGQAIHTLDLFSHEQMGSVYRSIETMYCEAINPLNEMVADTLQLLQSENVSKDDLQAHYLTVQGMTAQLQRVFLKHGGEVAPETPPVRSWIKDKRILVVDADRTVGATAGQFLFYYGCLVDCAADGKTALAMLQQTRYDAILCCIKLEDMSSFTFLMDARAQIGLPYLPLIYMQGFEHDKGHVVVKVRQEGIFVPVIYHKLIQHQLLSSLEQVFDEAEKVNVRSEKERFA